MELQNFTTIKWVCYLWTVPKTNEIENDLLRLSNFSDVLKRTSGTTGLIGQWMPANSGGGGLILNEDGTAYDQINRLKECTWSADDTTLTLQYDRGYLFDYIVEDNNLTIYSNNGSIVFTRIGN